LNIEIFELFGDRERMRPLDDFLQFESSHRYAVCKPALFDACPIAGRVVAERAFGIKMGDDGGGAPIVQIGWHPDGLLVHLPMLSFCSIKSTGW